MINSGHSGWPGCTPWPPTSPPSLAASCWLLGLYDCDDLKDAEPDTLRYRLLSLPARLVRHARSRVLEISRTWPWKDAFLACWAAAVYPARTRLTSHPVPATRKGGRPGAVGAGAIPSTSGSTATRQPATTAENRHDTISNRPRRHPESSRLVTLAERLCGDSMS